MDKNAALYFWIGLAAACILAGVPLMLTVRVLVGKALVLLGLVIALISTVQFVGQRIPILSWNYAAIWGIMATLTFIGFMLAKIFEKKPKEVAPVLLPPILLSSDDQALRKARKMLIDEARRYAKSEYFKPSDFVQQDLYFRLKKYFTPDGLNVFQSLERGIGLGGYKYQQKLLDEIANMERAWKLI